MQPISPARRALLKKLALACIGLVLAVLLFLWLALPRIIQSQAESFVAEKTGHRLTLTRPEINPFDLSLRVTALQLAQADGAPLLAFDELFVDLAAASLTRRMAVFDAIRLDGLVVTLVELPGGGHNWQPFLDALQAKESPASAEAPTEKAGLPRLEVRGFALTRGVLDFADRRRSPGFATRVEPLELSLTDISTLPDDNGKFQVAARTSIGARIALDGELAVNPLAVRGRFSLDDLSLGALAPYLKDVLPAPPAGTASLSASYRVGNGGEQVEASVEGIEAKLAGLRLPLSTQGATLAIEAVELKNGHFQWPRQTLDVDSLAVIDGRLDLAKDIPPPGFGALRLADIHVDLAGRAAELGQVQFADGRLQATRDAAGRIDLLEAVRPLVPPPSPEASPPWRYRIGKAEVAGLTLVARDAGVQPTAELAFENIALGVEGVSDDLAVPLPLRLAFDVRSGGRFEGEGRLTPATAAADLKFKLVDLALKPAQPYLAAKTTLTLADGKLSAAGRLTHDAAKGPVYRGDFAVRALRLDEGGERFLGWKTFGSHALTATPQRLDIGELRLNGLDARLIIDKDKSVNLKRVLRPVAEDAAQPSVPPAAAPFVVDIDRVRFFNSELYFADHSLVLPFGTRIHGLRGGLGNLSSRPGGAPGQLELEGEVDEYGMARAVGQVNLFDPTAFMDIRVLFKNVEMTRLTPYTATFAGRKIDSGKLSLDLQYKIKERQLAGENQIVMDRLTLGERVESPGAADLPLDLAIAILEDADGRIDLGLPVAGSLDDPEFSYGSIVWKAIRNVLTKIVTAPFRAIAALFGGAEKVEEVAFEAGAAQLAPPEREKLARLAGALAKRPALVLEIHGTFAAADRLALQDLQLRLALIEAMGQRVPEKGDPGPLSTSQPKVREALEDLYKKRLGASDLAALKEGYRRANPGKLEESMAGKMMSRLSGLLREKKTLSEAEVEQLKGADFHAVLYERLRAREAVGDDRLKALGVARGENAALALKSAGIAPERLKLEAPEPVESAGGNVLLKLALGAAQSGN